MQHGNYNISDDITRSKKKTKINKGCQQTAAHINDLQGLCAVGSTQE